MKVLVLTKYGRMGSSSRVRFYQYLPALEEKGVEFTVSELLDNAYIEDINRSQRNWLRILTSYGRRMGVLLSVRKYDVIWIEKEVLPGFPAIIERLFALFGIRYVVDYDDATFHSYDLGNNLVKAFLGNKIGIVMKNARFVVCGNSYIYDYARKNAVSDMTVIPSVVDTTTYKPDNTDRTSSRIIIGWIGSPTTSNYLDIVLQPLRKLSDEFDVCLRVIGAEYNRNNICIECLPWSEMSEVAEINNFDIGIMPLLDSEWERGKCGYKLIQCMACGKPVIASPVGVNSDIIRHGKNGYLAENDEEWYRYMKKLCENRQLAHSMGDKGRQVVEQEYSKRSQIDRLNDVLVMSVQ